VQLVYVFADAGRTPQPVPQALRDLLTAFEAGEEMVRLSRAAGTTWAVPLSACG
jgi:hypothetical protein